MLRVLASGALLAASLLSLCAPTAFGAGATEDYPFGRSTEYPNITANVKIAPFREDQHIDLFASGTVRGKEGIYFLPGDGDGTFDKRVKVGPRFLGDYVVENLNDDEFPDTIEIQGENAPYTLSVRLGSAGGDLSASQAYAASDDTFAIGDFDGDGVEDLAQVVPHPRDVPQEVGVRWGVGDGTFEAPTSVPVELEPEEIPEYQPALHNAVGGDLNGDGLDDLFGLASNQYSDGAVVTLIAGPGRTFDQAASEIAGDPLTGLSTDLDGDNYDDLIFNYHPLYGSGNTVFLSDGSGGLVPGQGQIGPDDDYGCRGLPAVGDLNDDSVPDLVGSCAGPTGANFVSFGDGTGGFSELALEPNQRGVGAIAGLADLNEDGELDLVLSREGLEIQLYGVDPPAPDLSANIQSITRVEFLGSVADPSKPGVRADVRCTQLCRASVNASLSKAVAEDLGLDSRVVAAGTIQNIPARDEESVAMQLKGEATRRARQAGLRRLEMRVTMNAKLIDPDFSARDSDERSFSMKYFGKWLDD